jgi:hypothetical protein
VLKFKRKFRRLKVNTKPGYSKLSISLRFPHQNPVRTSLLPHTTTCPNHLILRDFIARIIFAEEYSSLNYSLRNLLHSPASLSLLGPNTLLSTLFSSTVSLCSSLNVSDQVSHPYKTTAKIIDRYILLFIFLDSKLEDKNSAPNYGKHFLTPICWLNANVVKYGIWENA